MDSYYKLSFQIPRYVIAVTTEWLSVEDVSLFQQLAKSLCTTEESCIQLPPADRSTRNTNGSSSDANSKPIDNVWINAVAPEYQDLTDPSSTDSVFQSGWRRVHEQDVDVDDDGNQEVFAEMREKFGKAKSEVDSLSLTKMREYTGLVASELDKIADELPVGGYLLDVVWLMPTSTDFPILERPDAFLFSVLRRLEVWHNARITILLGQGLEGKDHPSLVHWTTFIESRVVELRTSDGKDTNVDDIMAQSASLAWQGQVKYISSRGTAFPPWPGFSLHRLADDSHRSEPFIEILNSSSNQQDVAGSQPSMDDSFISLSNHDIKSKHVVNETLEFIHLANLHEIPSWFILPGKFELRLRDKEKRQRYSRSRFWMRYLTHRLPGDGQGAICQLSCLEVDGPVPEAQSAGRTTQVWTSGITNDPLNPTMPNVQLKGTRHTFFFLVHGDRRGRCIALPLVSPFMLNGAAHSLLACHEEQERTTENEDVAQPAREVLDSLPTLNGRQLCEEEEELARMQVKALSMVIEKIRSEGLEINVTPSLLIFLFNYMRKVFYDGYSIGEDRSSPTSQDTPAGDSTSSQTAPPQADIGGEGAAASEDRVDDSRLQGVETENANQTRPARIDPTTLPTELDQSPSQWVERQALQNRESIANRLRRLGSEDLTLGGFTVPPPDTSTITLSAKEFRSHFKPNGQPKRDELVLVPRPGVRHSPRTRSAVAGHYNNGPTAEELMQTEFSDSLNIKYHGITYCKETPDSQMIDLKMMRLQQRCVRQEMACTFTSHHRPTLAIRTKRKHSDSPSTNKAKMRKLSASAKKKSSMMTRQMTPKKRTMPSRTAKTPQKGVGSTPKRSTTPRSRKKRARLSTVGGLTPKRLKRSTPLKSTKPEEMASPRRSARKLARDLQPSTSTFTSPSTSTHQPSSSSPSASTSTASSKAASASKSTPSKKRKPSKESAKSAEKEKKARTASESRSEKHKRKLRSIVEETLAAKGIDSSHVCFQPCVSRLYMQTKMFVKDLKSSKGLYEEMRKIAEANADFVITFEQNRVASKS